MLRSSFILLKELISNKLSILLESDGFSVVVVRLVVVGRGVVVVVEVVVEVVAAIVVAAGHQVCCVVDAVDGGCQLGHVVDVWCS